MSEVYAMLSIGDSRYVDEDYDAAIEAYSQALSIMEQEVDEDAENFVHLACALSHRAAAYLQIGKASEAFNDATSASTVLRERAALSPSLSSVQKEQIHSREGQAALLLDRGEHAMEAFSRAAELANESTREKYSEWLARCQQKLDLDSQKTKTDATPAPVDVPVPVQPAPVPAASTSSKSGRPIVPKYQYYQNDNFMTISILEPSVKPEDLNVTFGLDHLTVILTKSGKNLTVICGTLFDCVNIEKCKTKFMDEKVLIKLKKLEKHEWQDLFGLGKQDKKEEDPKTEMDDIDPETGIKKMVPTIDPHKAKTPYASQRDWGAIERDLKEQEKNEKPEGEEAMNVLFKDVYSKADENTKRAMIKSFQTSGGTVLSTNWNEVSKTDYEKERQAPKGMEWKSWEGKKLPQKDAD